MFPRQVGNIISPAGKHIQRDMPLAWYSSTMIWPRGIFLKCQNYPNFVLVILGYGAPHLITESKPGNSCRVTSFPPPVLTLFFQSLPTAHEDRNVNLPLNRVLCLQTELLLHHHILLQQLQQWRYCWSSCTSMSQCCTSMTQCCTSMTKCCTSMTQSVCQSHILLFHFPKRSQDNKGKVSPFTWMEHLTLSAREP